MKTEIKFYNTEIPQQDLISINGGVIVFPEGGFTSLLIKILSFLDPTGIL